MEPKKPLDRSYKSLPPGLPCTHIHTKHPACRGHGCRLEGTALHLHLRASTPQERGAGQTSFVAEGVDGVEAGGAAGGVQACD
jgi:hypothetical protein